MGEAIGRKTGRPTEEPKTQVARLRLTESERRKLEECCQITGLSITGVLKLGMDKVYREAAGRERGE